MTFLGTARYAGYLFTLPYLVFPTALDARGDGRVDVYYGMADYRIGVGKIQVPVVLQDP